MGFFNYFLFQWFFLRFFAEVEEDECEYFGILFGAAPLSGWADKPYRYVTKNKKPKLIWCSAP